MDCVDLKKLVMNEINQIPYYGNPRYKNTIKTIRKKYFWHGMKKDIA